jgi:chromosome segregation ATPase
MNALSDLQMKYDQILAENKELEKELEEDIVNRDEHQNSLVENRKRVSILEQENQRLQDALATMREQLDEDDATQYYIREQENKIADLQSSLSQRDVQIEDLLHANEAELIRMQSKVEASQAELAQQVRLVQNQSMELAQLQTVLEDTRAQLPDQSKFVELQYRLEAAEELARENTVRRHQLETEQTALTAEVELLRNRLGESKKGHAAEIDALYSELASAEAEINRASQELQDLQDGFAEENGLLNVEIHGLKGLVEQLENDLSNASVPMPEDVSDELAAAQARNEELVEELSLIRAQKMTGKDTEALENQIAELELAQRISESTKRDILRKAKMLKDHTAQTVEQLREQLLAAQSRIADLESQSPPISETKDTIPEDEDDFDWNW